MGQQSINLLQACRLRRFDLWQGAMFHVSFGAIYGFS
jgi:hypothetical protein